MQGALHALQADWRGKGDLCPRVRTGETRERGRGVAPTAPKGLWRLLIPVPIVALVALVVTEDANDVHEDVNEVEEELQGVPEGVTAAGLDAVNHHLGVHQDPQVEDEEAAVHTQVVDHGALEKNVCETNPEKAARCGHQGAGEVEVLATTGREGSDSEGAEKEDRHHGCGDKDARSNDVVVIEEQREADTVEATRTVVVPSTPVVVIESVGGSTHLVHAESCGHHRNESRDIEHSAEVGTDGGDYTTHGKLRIHIRENGA